MVRDEVTQVCRQRSPVAPCNTCQAIHEFAHHLNYHSLHTAPVMQGYGVSFGGSDGGVKHKSGGW